ncbi:hypothetical protein ACIO1C_24540 [Streptomyces sp. NPDC087420]|uniref:hypothetical protein n=1 Tax=Streptomyces sp. NPDC087420 TaxID=3365785 RepID=UPI00383749B4
MTADPRDVEGIDEIDDIDEIGTETPEDDAAEQRAEVRPDDEDDNDAASGGPLGGDPAEVDEGDAAEQARTVILDEDEYR